MGRTVAMLWHALFSVAAGVLYFFFVLPRWPELMGDTTHALGTALRIVVGALIGLAALPVVFTLLRTRKPEAGTPQLVLSLRIGSIAAHTLAGVLIVGTAISEIWLSLNAAGPWLFGIYGAAAAVAILAIFAFYLSFVAELPPPSPKPAKPQREPILRRLRRKRDRKKGPETAEVEVSEAETVEAETVEAQTVEAEVSEAETVEAQTVEADEAQVSEADEAVDVGTGAEAGGPPDPSAQPAPTAPASGPESGTEEPPAAEDALTTEAPRGRLRNRRPRGKSSMRPRRGRPRGGVAVEDAVDD
ncbi:MAG: hypothetical protein QJR12_01120 [Mycobacterium sp.]|uniref:hypothetical protein n=1 Tax=Mycobacterium sp. TaxID=1785 RepID=UPI00261840AA|nr:hypothetical protein [Mycobacterium sp.]MDI3312922.1 hypothetical protein [Mycobacterium sp.]